MRLYIRSGAPLLAVAGILVVQASASSACTPPTEDTQISILASSVPAAQAPKDAIQMRVEAPRDVAWERSKLRLKVVEVLSGTFAGEQIVLNVGNVENCNVSFSDYTPRQADGTAYITVRPLMYSDGAPVLDQDGEQEYGGLTYEQRGFLFAQDAKMPEFAEYSSLSSNRFENLAKTACLFEGGNSAAAWRKCVDAGEAISLVCEPHKSGAFVCEDTGWPDGRPQTMMRGYSLWQHQGSVIALVGVLFLALVGYGSLQSVQLVNNDD